MKYLLALILVTSILFLVACNTTTKTEVPPEKFCNSASECVPASCCHPKDAVNSAYAPNCQGMMCTMNCEPGTLDCGQGEIKCIDNQCTAIIK